MRYKFWLWVVIVLGVVLIGLVLFRGARNMRSFDMSVARISENSDMFRIEAEYPQFKNASAAFNKEIADWVTQAVADFKNDSSANWQARKATSPSGSEPVNPAGGAAFDFRGSWQATQLNNEYISFTEKIYYFSGGAHGNDELRAFNYDVKKDKELTILDVVGSQANLDKIAEIAKQDIGAELQSKGMELNGDIKAMIDAGSVSSADNYKNFNFNLDALTIYFEKYQVAPGVAGQITVPIYRGTLNALGVKSDYIK